MGSVPPAPVVILNGPTRGGCTTIAAVIFFFFVCRKKSRMVSGWPKIVGRAINLVSGFGDDVLFGEARCHQSLQQSQCYYVVNTTE